MSKEEKELYEEICELFGSEYNEQYLKYNRFR